MEGREEREEREERRERTGKGEGEGRVKEGEEGINTICGALWGSSHCNKVW